MKHVAELNGVPPRRAPYSIATVAGGFAFISGQGPFTREDELIVGDFEAQARQAFENVLAVVNGLGATSKDVVRVGIYLRDMSVDFAAMNVLFAEFFPAPFPARTTIPTAGLRFDIEIDAVVWLGDQLS